jgi:hypothetical protein
MAARAVALAERGRAVLERVMAVQMRAEIQESGQVAPMARYVLKIADNPGAVYGPEVGKGRAVRTDDTLVRSGVGRQIRVRRALGGNGSYGPPEFAWAQ